MSGREFSVRIGDDEFRGMAYRGESPLMWAEFPDVKPGRVFATAATDDELLRASAEELLDHLIATKALLAPITSD